MRIAIVGCGMVGRKIASDLSDEGHDITVVDIDKNRTDAFEDRKDVICIEDSAVNYVSNLEDKNQDVLIACTNSDEVNMLTCLIAKKHGIKLTIARVRNPEYNKNYTMFIRELGIGMCINPEMSTARAISKLLLFPSADGIETFADGRVELIEFKIDKDNQLIGKSLREIDNNYNVKVLICAIQRDEEVIIPSGDVVVEEGDYIFIVAGKAEMQEFFRSIHQFNSQIENVLIVGGGTTSFYLAKLLYEMNVNIKIIEKDPERIDKLYEAFGKDLGDGFSKRITLALGDGSSNNILKEEGLFNADALVSLTNKDETNVLISLYASKNKLKKVIAKINQTSFAETIKSFGVDSVVSPKTVTANGILRHIRGYNNAYDSSSIESVLKVCNGKAEALEFKVKMEDSYVDKPIIDLKIKKGYILAAIIRKNKVIIPGGKDTILSGDTVIVLSVNEKTTSLEEIFE